MRDLAHQDDNFDGSLRWIWKYLHERSEPHLPLNENKFLNLVKSGKIIFLLDGFDEIAEHIDQRTISKYTRSEFLLATNNIISCRVNFYELYLTNSELDRTIAHKVKLLQFNDLAIEDYIHKYCAQIKNIHAKPDEIVSFLKGSQQLWNLSKTPLLLNMILETYIEGKLEDKREWTITDLYSSYTDMWLMQESFKPDSQLKWEEKDVCMEHIAWAMYSKIGAFSSSLEEDTNFIRHDIKKIVKDGKLYEGRNAEDVIDDICLRTVLIGKSGGFYYFIHKSFQDYYTAKYIVSTLQESSEKVGCTLANLIPVEVATHIKNLLDALNSSQKFKVTEILSQTVVSKTGDESLSNVMVRDHSMYYIARLRTEEGIKFLLNSLNKEKNKLVQRGIIMGLVLFCNQKWGLDYYIKHLEKDKEARSINMGYHLLYYGDQSYEQGYEDAGGIKCDGTYKAILRHLHSQQHKNGWPLDIFTFRDILQHKERKQILIRNGVLEEMSNTLNSLPNDESLLLNEQVKKLHEELSSFK